MLKCVFGALEILEVVEVLKVQGYMGYLGYNECQGYTGHAEY